MKIRKYQATDIDQVFKLFFNTVHNINSKDYDSDQINVWAPANYDYQKLNNKLVSSNSLMIEDNNLIVAFGDIQNNGYIDHFYVSHLKQGQGIGKLLLAALEKLVSKDITEYSSHVSISAYPFFLANGYQLVLENTVTIDNFELINYYMKKGEK
ncbi:MAG: GNAT family N-acetyltransferase [Erysipelothrix sp.]|nr:GNAT family N-acetyltransferase [Erysipelothrix sp.]